MLRVYHATVLNTDLAVCMSTVHMPITQLNLFRLICLGQLMNINSRTEVLARPRITSTCTLNRIPTKASKSGELVMWFTWLRVGHISESSLEYSGLEHGTWSFNGGGSRTHTDSPPETLQHQHRLLGITITLLSRMAQHHTIR